MSLGIGRTTADLVDMPFVFQARASPHQPTQSFGVQTFRLLMTQHWFPNYPASHLYFKEKVMAQSDISAAMKVRKQPKPKEFKILRKAQFGGTWHTAKGILTFTETVRVLAQVTEQV